MRVVVTGATSMIAVALINKCLEEKCEVLAISYKGSSRISRIPKSDLITVVEGSYEEIASNNKVDKEYDVFYHFAWANTSKEKRDDVISQEENIRSTLLAVEFAHKLGCKKFIGAGSQAEYGQVRGIINEETRPMPITAYGIAKYSANMMSRRMCEKLGMTHVWARIFSVYGSLDNEGTMINYAIGRFSKGEVAKFSAATQMWNYLNEKDAGMYFYLLGKMGVEPGIYCIANTESRVLRSYIEELCNVFGNGARCEFAEENGSEIFGLEVDMSKTVSATKYLPEVSFRNGIEKILSS